MHHTAMSARGPSELPNGFVERAVGTKKGDAN